MKPVAVVGIFLIGVGIGVAVTQAVHIHEETEAYEKLQAMKNVRYKLRMQQRNCPTCVANTKRNFERIVADL